MFIAHGGADHPVNLHAAHAAQAADVAEQAATVAQRVAAHTEAVAADTAAALRYTQDALKRAGADKKDIDEVGKEADKMDEEAGTSTKKHSSSKGSKKSSNLDSEEMDASSSISKDDTESDTETNIGADGRVKSSSSDGSDSDSASASSSSSASGDSASPLDVNSQIVPYPNSVEPFGQEQPAKELTKASVKQSDSMVDKIENAQGTESKRAVYRALTKLRGATIASYDGMAKGHLSNVDHYNKKSKWRDLHPMKHLAEEESDTHIWAFPKKSTKKKPTFADNKKKKAAAAPAPAEPASPA